MKKIIILLLVLVMALPMAFAGDFSFVFGDLGQHPEILAGFIPSYLLLGGGYDGLELIDGNKTSIQLLLGAGYNQRKVWYDPDPENPQVDNIDIFRMASPIVYDVIETDWHLRFNQGFLASPVEGKDLITLTASYRGKFEVNRDSMVVGKSRKNGFDYHEIKTLDSYIGKDYQGYIYPDLQGDRMMLGTSFALTFKLDMMDDKMTTTDGFVMKAEAEYAPLLLNNALGGKADYYSLTLNAVAAKTLYELELNGKDYFTIVAIDRFNVNWTDGSAVPVYAQGPVSLGRKMRGFNTWTYGTNLSVVNNFDIRLAGPVYFGLFHLINFLFDIGYGAGNYFNTDVSGSNFLASTGAEFTVSLFDFIDLGYEIAYLFCGDKYTAGDSRVVTAVTFFLDF